MTRVVVRPYGSGRETLVVVMLCAVIVATAATVATIRARPADETVLADWRIDARDGLNAAEQGLNADLMAAADDIRAEISDGGPPTPERLANDALPPFAKDATTTKRGGHGWSLARDGETVGYLGATGDAAVAGSILLRIAPPAKDGHGHDGESASTVWAHPSSRSVAGLTDERLIAAGWKQVTSRYDSSVTREAK
ncbi:DUF6162 family protein [Methylopila sp. M107]|uniref:DUF6162 family protein n=1 Tax=Methylopila sp. M107 TaxID=1101190 RepID=UPI00036F7493|nr:DUF6162 family protein [Methylopila sp. M107]